MKLITVLLIVFLIVGGNVTAQPDTGPYHEVRVLGRGMIRSAAWSPDGKMIAVGGALGIWLYTDHLEDIGLLKGHTKAVYGLAFSPDGAKLASASHDMTVRIWDIATQTELHTLEGHTDLTVAVAWSPDGKTVASGAYDNTVRLWDAETGELIRVFEGNSDWVENIGFSSDGLLVESKSRDGIRRWWNAITGEMFDEMALSILLRPPEINPAGNRIVQMHWDGGIELIDPLADKILATRYEHVDWISALSWEDNQLTSSSSDGKLRLWDAATGGLIDISDGQLEPGPVEAQSPDGSKIAAVGDSGTTITEAATGEIIAVLPGPSNAVVWSPDGLQLAVALRNGTIKIWGEQ